MEGGVCHNTSSERLERVKDEIQSDKNLIKVSFKFVFIVY